MLSTQSLVGVCVDSKGWGTQGQFSSDDHPTPPPPHLNQSHPVVEVSESVRWINLFCPLLQNRKRGVLRLALGCFVYVHIPQRDWVKNKGWGWYCGQNETPYGQIETHLGNLYCFGVFCAGTYPPKGLSKEQGLGVVLWAKWDPIWANWDPSGLFVRKVGKSALELGEKNSIIGVRRFWTWPNGWLDVSQYPGSSVGHNLVSFRKVI